MSLRRIRSNVMGASEREVQNVPRVSVFQNTGGTLVTTVVTLVSWDSVDWDTDGMFSLAFPTRITARTAGLYAVGAWYSWDVNSAGQRGLLLRRTAKSGVISVFPNVGVLNEGGDVTAVGSGLRTTSGPMWFDMVLQAGDYVEVFVSQFSGSTIAWIAATTTDKANGIQAKLVSTI